MAKEITAFPNLICSRTVINKGLYLKNTPLLPRQYELESEIEQQHALRKSRHYDRASPQQSFFPCLFFFSFFPWFIVSFQFFLPHFLYFFLAKIFSFSSLIFSFYLISFFPFTFFFLYALPGFFYFFSFIISLPSLQTLTFLYFLSLSLYFSFLLLSCHSASSLQTRC